MGKLIDDLSILAKTDTKQVILKKEIIWLHDLIHDEIERFRQNAKLKGVNLITSELPSISIFCDKYWLQMMISIF